MTEKSNGSAAGMLEIPGGGVHHQEFTGKQHRLSPTLWDGYYLRMACKSGYPNAKKRTRSLTNLIYGGNPGLGAR